MRKYFFKQHFTIIYRRLTKNIMAFENWSTFLVHFTMLAPSQLIHNDYKEQRLHNFGR